MGDKVFELLYSSGLCVSQGLDETSFLDSDVGKDSTPFDMNTGWVLYRLPVFSDGGATVGVSLGFHAGQLSQIRLCDVDPMYGSTWDEWSEAKERLRAERTRDWLIDKGFPPGLYKWGEVWVGIDFKGGFGGATIRYESQVE